METTIARNESKGLGALNYLAFSISNVTMLIVIIKFYNPSCRGDYHIRNTALSLDTAVRTDPAVSLIMRRVLVAAFVVASVLGNKGRRLFLVVFSYI